MENNCEDERGVELTCEIQEREHFSVHNVLHVLKYNLFFKDALRNDLMLKTDAMQSKSYGMFEKRFRCSGCWCMKEKE